MTQVEGAWRKEHVRRSATQLLAALRRSTAGVLFAALAFLVGPSAIAQTRAGTAIENVARVDYRVGDAAAVSGLSNTNRLIVAERLDVTLAAAAATIPSTGPGVPIGWAVTLRNAGNGDEAFALEPGVPAGAGVAIAVDADGDGRFDPAHDRLLDGISPTLAPGEAVALLLLVSPPATGFDAGATLTLAARATTGSGTPGSVFAGGGDGGGDAVTGPTGAAGRVSVPLASDDAPQLIKSQATLAPDGSARAVSGATVTYTLDARFAGPAPAARIEDVVPAGTILVPDSLLLDGSPLSDAADGDAGTANASGIAVSLGDIPGPATRRVQFKVQIR